MLGLRQDIRSSKGRIGGFIRQHEHLTWAGQQINRYMSHQQTLGRHHVRIAGAKNFLHRLNRLGAMSHRGNRVSTAYPINLGGTGHFGRVQQAGIYRAILAAGRAHYNLPTTGDLGKRHGHQRRTHQRRRATRDVHAHAPERIKLLPHLRALRITAVPAFAQALFMKLANVPVGKPNGALQLGIDCLPGRGQLALAHAQRLGRELGAVKFLGEFNQRSIALGGHPFHNRTRARLDFRIKQTRGRAQAVELAGVAGISMSERVHGPRSEAEARAKVKKHPLALTDRCAPLPCPHS